MIDYHIHIGQFRDHYYDSLEVFSAIEEFAEKIHISRIYYSSTSSCRSDVSLEKIEEEIAYAQSLISEKITQLPYLWWTTNYVEQNISIKSAMESFDYCGIKLHPLAHNWDLTDSKHIESLCQIFQWSSDNNKPILLHSGDSYIENPLRFEKYYKEFPNAKVILAHCVLTDNIIFLFDNYPNIYGDTACVDHNHIQTLMNSKYKHRILFGTDFPITHYWAHHLHGEHISLQEQYKRDCQILSKAGLYSDCSREEI
ncbi:MAG: amidohydrolase family protein [Spirochaetales bacterium]|nr:amidohydrolase family protein [Spirochaetales bacterium]